MNQHRRFVAAQAIKAKADRERTSLAKLTDWMTANVGTVFFLSLNLLFFAGWIIFNSEMLVGAKPFDPFPFNFLTMFVSLEAITLSIIVLISQNRASRVDDIREEIDLQVNTITEIEITKILELLTKLLEAQGVDTSKDEALQEMLLPTKKADIEREIRKQIG
jgi:uncharacterized membrane protein